MRPRTVSSTVSLVTLLALLTRGATATAQSRGIRDEGAFFGAEAIDSAAQAIAQIARTHQKDVCVETFAEIPAELQSKYQLQGKQRFFEQWTNDRAVQRHVDGVYILILKHPGHLQVWVGDQTEQRLFTVNDRDTLVRGLAGRFRRREYDAGLVSAVRFVQRQMDEHSKANADPTRSVYSLPPSASVGSARRASKLCKTSVGDLP